MAVQRLARSVPAAAHSVPSAADRRRCLRRRPPARNPKSEFFLSIKISYPNREDAAVAHESGFAPGGLIMIHGQPNEPKRPLQHYATRDWTDGCIALSNADMVDVWLRTTTGIPIEIRK